MRERREQGEKAEGVEEGEGSWAEGIRVSCEGDK